MNRTDYILTLTKGILETPEENVETLLEYYGKFFELKEIQKSGFVSLAAGLDDTNKVGFAEWVKLLRAEKVTTFLVRAVTQVSDQLPAHMAAAFAGTQEYLIEIITEKTARCYVMQTMYSPSYAITPTLFAELLDAQSDRDLQWELVSQLITDSNELNGRKAVHKTAVREYLNSKEGNVVFDILASSLTEEMQIECVVSAKPFIIPNKLKNLFEQSSFSFEGEDREIAFLNTLQDVSPEQVIALAHAQPFAEAVWLGCETELKEYPLADIPIVKASEFETFIKEQTIQKLNSSGLAHVVCRAIRTLCEKHHVRPTIPESLKEFFGPNKKEYDKALARGRTKDKWYLKSYEKSWEVCFFEPLLITTLSEPKIDLQKLKQEFEQALTDIEIFAKKIESPFQESFRLANYFLTGRVPSGSYDYQHFEIISNDLKEKGFSEKAIEVLKNNFVFMEEWYNMKFDVATVHGLFAVNNVNHFGGMGSWNDQYVENDHETYEKISSETFFAMKNYFVSILSK